MQFDCRNPVDESWGKLSDLSLGLWPRGLVNWALDNGTHFYRFHKNPVCILAFRSNPVSGIVQTPFGRADIPKVHWKPGLSTFIPRE
jgi:hypothetical protein